MKTKMKEIITPIMFLLLPFGMISPGLIWKSQQLFFIIMPVAIAAFWIKNLWVRAFLLYASAWQLFLFIYSLGRGPNISPGAALSYSLCIMAGALVYYFVSNGTLEKERWYNFIRVAVLLQCVFAVGQFFGQNPVVWLMSHIITVKQNLPTHLVGSLGNRNFLAAFVAFSLPLWMEGRWRWFLPLIWFVLVFCVSPGTIAAILGTAFYIAYARGLKPLDIMAYMAGAAVLGIIFAATYVLTTGYHIDEFQRLPGQLYQFFTTGQIDNDIFKGDLGRFGMWLTAAGLMIKSIPGMIFGFGPGAFWGREYNLHSEYVATWFYFGLIGLFLLLGYIATTWRFLWKHGDKVFLTTFLIICIDIGGNFPFEVPTTGMMGLIFMGLIERERLKCDAG